MLESEAIYKEWEILKRATLNMVDICVQLRGKLSEILKVRTFLFVINLVYTKLYEHALSLY